MAKIPGMGVAAKQVQKQIQKSLNRGGREVLENVGRQTPDLLNTISDMNKSGIVKSIDSGLYSPEDVEKVFRNNDYSGLTDIANDGNSKALVDQTNQQYSNWIHPKPAHKNNFTVSKENLAPGIEAVNLENQIADAKKIHGEFAAIQQSGKKLGEKELSIGSTIGSIDQKKSFNLSPIEKAESVERAVGKTNIKEIPGKRGVRKEISAEIENVPYKELHHIVGKSMGEKLVSNVWRLIDEGKASVEDLINLNYWAKSYQMGMGDFGAEAVNRVPHSRTHMRSRAFNIEMSSKEIKEIPEFDDINELTSYFRSTIENRAVPMRGELDIQQGIYDLLPKKARIEVEQLKVAKEKASRDLTDRYKKIYGEKMPDTPEEVKDGYQTHIWLQRDLNVDDSKLIKYAEKLDDARMAQDDQLEKVGKQLKKLEAEELASLDRKAIKTGRPGKQTSQRAQEKINYSQARDETYAGDRMYAMQTGAEPEWGN